MEWIRSLQIECFAIEHVQWICSFLGPSLGRTLVQGAYWCSVPLLSQKAFSVSCPADSRYSSIDFIRALAVKMQETADIGCSLGSSQLAFHFDEFIFHPYTIHNMYMIHLIEVSIKDPSFWGTPPFMETPHMYIHICSILFKWRHSSRRRPIACVSKSMRSGTDFFLGGFYNGNVSGMLGISPCGFPAIGDFTIGKWWEIIRISRW